MGETIAVNRKARHDYTIEDTLEAGLVLRGTEIKSVRAGKVNLQESFARIERGECLLYGCDIQPYERASWEQHQPQRVRRLLLLGRGEGISGGRPPRWSVPASPMSPELGPTSS